MSGLKNKSYQEAADDVYVDTIRDLEFIRDDNMHVASEQYMKGLQMAIDYLKEKRSELYG